MYLPTARSPASLKRRRWRSRHCRRRPAPGCARLALLASVIVTVTALMDCGAVTGRFSGASPLLYGLQIVLIGGLAAGAAFLIARLTAG